MLKIFNTYYSIRSLLFCLGETCCIMLGIAGAIYLLNQGRLPQDLLRLDLWLRIGLVSLVLQTCLYYNDLYSFPKGQRFSELLLGLGQALGSACIILALIYLVLPGLILSQTVFFPGILLVVCLLLSWRLLYLTACRRHFLNEKIILLGDRHLARLICQEINKSLDSGYTVAAVFSNPGDSGLAQSLAAKLYQDFDQLCSVAQQLKVGKIIMALEERRGKSPVDKLLECKLQGIRILDGVSFFENLSGKILATQTTPSWLIFSEGFHRHKLGLFCKRSCDLLSASLGLVLLSPVLGLIALGIKGSSPGPVLYLQQRVGQRGQLFWMVKFRSMRQDAERPGTAVWAGEDDPRITGIGRILRRFRMDELPQLWNVLKGEMSFVGPRPERPEFVEHLKSSLPYYGERHSLKPGLTGWAQVNYGYGASDEDALRKLEYDLFYIKNFSLFLDLFIILKTVKAVFFSEGAR